MHTTAVTASQSILAGQLCSVQWPAVTTVARTPGSTVPFVLFFWGEGLQLRSMCACRFVRRTGMQTRQSWKTLSELTRRTSNSWCPTTPARRSLTCEDLTALITTSHWSSRPNSTPWLHDSRTTDSYWTPPLADGVVSSVS